MALENRKFTSEGLKKYRDLIRSASKGNYVLVFVVTNPEEGYPEDLERAAELLAGVTAEHINRGVTLYGGEKALNLSEATKVSSEEINEID